MESGCQLSIVERVQTVGILFKIPIINLLMENLFEELVYSHWGILFRIDSQIAEVVRQCCKAILHRPILITYQVGKSKVRLAVLFAMNLGSISDEPLSPLTGKSRLEILEILKSWSLMEDSYFVRPWFIWLWSLYRSHMVELRDGPVKGGVSNLALRWHRLLQRKLLLVQNYSIWTVTCELDHRPLFHFWFYILPRNFLYPRVIMALGNQPSSLHSSLKSIKDALLGRGQFWKKKRGVSWLDGGCSGSWEAIYPESVWERNCN